MARQSDFQVTPKKAIGNSIPKDTARITVHNAKAQGPYLCVWFTSDITWEAAMVKFAGDFSSITFIKCINGAPESFRIRPIDGEKSRNYPCIHIPMHGFKVEKFPAKEASEYKKGKNEIVVGVPEELRSKFLRIS